MHLSMFGRVRQVISQCIHFFAESLVTFRILQEEPEYIAQSRRSRVRSCYNSKHAVSLDFLLGRSGRFNPVLVNLSESRCISTILTRPGRRDLPNDETDPSSESLPSVAE